MARVKCNGMPWGHGSIEQLARWARGCAHAVLLGALGLTLSSAALAQEDAQQKAAAEALFSEGQELLFHHEYEAACRRFEQSQAIDPGVGTLLYLGDCYERLGKLASAWAIYLEAASVAKASGQADRSRVASEHARKLESALSKLTVRVATEDHMQGFDVTVNGKPLVSAMFGVAFNIDAGRYELVARAPGRAEWSSVVEVKVGEQKSIEVPALQPANGEGRAPGSSSPASDIFRNLGTNDEDDGKRLTPQQTTGLIVGGAGVAAIGAGVLLGLKAQSKDNDAKHDCPAGCVTQAAVDLNRDARTWAAFANGTYFLGALALVTGGVLYFMPQKAEGVAGRLPLDVSAALGRGGGMLTVGGEL